MFIQPNVTASDGWQGRLDDAIGAGKFALLCRGVNPRRWLDPDVTAQLDALDTRGIWVVPATQCAYEAARTSDVLVLGDRDRRIKQWFDRNPNPVVLLRPDRFIAIDCTPQEINDQVRICQPVCRSRSGTTSHPVGRRRTIEHDGLMSIHPTVRAPRDEYSGKTSWHPVGICVSHSGTALSYFHLCMLSGIVTCAIRGGTNRGAQP